MTTTTLTVDDILDAAPAAKRHEVRTIGPAVVLVLELEAPLRLELVSSSPQEEAALREWITCNPGAEGVLRTFFALQEDQEGGEIVHTPRETAHYERLYD